MDYHVFVVSRIKELRDAGSSTDEAVVARVASVALARRGASGRVRKPRLRSRMKHA